MSAPAPAVTPPLSVNPERSWRVLVVEDDPAFRYLCTEALSADGDTEFLVHEADTAKQALTILLEHPMDCVLIDYNLPDADGKALMNAIRESIANWSGALVVMTAGGSEEVASEAIRAGALDYIPKQAISPPALRRALGNAIEKAQLYRSIVERNAELASANTQLKKHADEISRFYHRVSHEIKTPLTAARMFMSMLHEGLAGALSDEQRDIVAQAMQSCDELTSQFNDLVECTRLETGKLTMHKSVQSLHRVLERSAVAVLPAAEAKQIELIRDIDPDLPEVCVDGGRIVQVVANLLGNAVKFTEDGGHIVLRARVSPAMETFVEIKVEDSGVGIAPEHLPHVFDRLYQVSSVGDALMGAGLGLGLTIAKEIVELHRGTIDVSSTLNQGSTFTVCLPIATD